MQLLQNSKIVIKKQVVEILSPKKKKYTMNNFPQTLSKSITTIAGHFSFDMDMNIVIILEAIRFRKDTAFKESKQGSAEQRQFVKTLANILFSIHVNSYVEVWLLLWYRIVL